MRELGGGRDVFVQGDMVQVGGDEDGIVALGCHWFAESKMARTKGKGGSIRTISLFQENVKAMRNRKIEDVMQDLLKQSDQKKSLPHCLATTDIAPTVVMQEPTTVVPQIAPAAVSVEPVEKPKKEKMKKKHAQQNLKKK